MPSPHQPSYSYNLQFTAEILGRKYNFSFDTNKATISWKAIPAFCLLRLCKVYRKKIKTAHMGTISRKQTFQHVRHLNTGIRHMSEWLFSPNTPQIILFKVAPAGCSSIYTEQVKYLYPDRTFPATLF